MLLHIFSETDEYFIQNISVPHLYHVKLNNFLFFYFLVTSTTTVWINYVNFGGGEIKYSHCIRGEVNKFWRKGIGVTYLKWQLIELIELFGIFM